MGQSRPILTAVALGLGEKQCEMQKKREDGVKVGKGCDCDCYGFLEGEDD